MNPVRDGLVALSLCLLPAVSEAACSGSGTTWSCTAGTTVAQVNSALSSADDGATLTFATGTYSWSAGGITLDNTKGVTLICASAGTCDVPFGGGTPTLIELVFSGTNSKLYRISGFEFQDGGECATCIWFYGDGTLSNFRVDHNTWTGFPHASAAIFLGSNSNRGYFYGVVDHNTIIADDDNMIVKIVGHNINESFSPSYPQVHTAGTANNLFIEDNTFTIATSYSDVACLDAHQGAAIVLRYNTAVNCRGFDVHGMPHGGISSWEVYRNTVSKTVSELPGSFDEFARAFLNQGSGEWYVWDNSISPYTTNAASWAIDFLYHRDPSSGQVGTHLACDGTRSVDGNVSGQAGYPCMAQPGRGNASTSNPGDLYPVVFFGNYNPKTGAKIDGNFSDQGSSPEHVQADRDFYNAVSASLQSSSTSPFDGTTGIGRGTLANRPTTCTHTTAPDGDEGGGVMYWATDQGSWCTGCDDGVLYRCSSTNTWTVHYTPYAYPHPSVGGADTTPPAVPSGVYVTQRRAE